MASEPVLFAGASAAFQPVAHCFKDFHDRVLQQTGPGKGRGKGLTLRRVSEEVPPSLMKTLTGIIESIFFQDESTKQQLYMPPHQPTGLFKDIDNQHLFQQACKPMFYAVGANTSAMGIEALCSGSLRVSLTGRRQFAAVKFPLWLSFCHTKTTDAAADEFQANVEGEGESWKGHPYVRDPSLTLVQAKKSLQDDDRGVRERTTNKQTNKQTQQTKQTQT